MKKIISLILIGIMTLSLAGCGSTNINANNTVEQEQKDYEEQEVTYYIKETRISEVTGYEPPTYSAVGTNDGIANWRIMERQLL